MTVVPIVKTKKAAIRTDLIIAARITWGGSIRPTGLSRRNGVAVKLIESKRRSSIARGCECIVKREEAKI